MTSGSKRAVALSLLSLAAPIAPQDEAFPPATPESQGLSPEGLQQLAEQVQGFVDKGRIVGAELLVIKNRRTVLHEGFGWRDREAKKPMVKDSIFNIRSMTKTVTGAGAQLLIDSGLLTLDSRAADILPGFDNERSGAITLEHLLTHTSGLPLGTKGAPTYPTDLAALANMAGEAGPRFEPGSKFWYSDAGTNVLGAITAAVSEQSLGEFRREHLFEPLGMRDSFTPTDRTDPRYERIVALYLGSPGSWTRFWTPEDEPRYPVALGAQTIYSTTRDYARFLAMWMDDGMVGDERLLSEEAIARTLKPVSRMTPMGTSVPIPNCFRGLETRYGQMSVVYVDPDAPPSTTPYVFGHSGSDGTWAWAWPELDLMVLYFTQSRGQASGFRLAMQVDRLIIHGSDPPIPLPEECEPYLGTYIANFDAFHNQEFEIIEHDGHLMLDIPASIAFELKGPSDTGVWTAGLQNEMQLTFVLDEDGTVTAMRMNGNDLPRGQVDRQEVVELTLADVEELLGFYKSEIAGDTVEIIFEHGNLCVRVPNVPQAHAFHPADEEGRWVLAMSPQTAVRFNSDENGVIVSYSIIIQGREVGKRVRVPEEGGG